MEDRQRLLNKRRKDVRRVLWQWGDTMRLCKRKLDEIKALQAMIDDARQRSPAPPDGLPKASGVSDPTADSAARVEEIIASFAESVAIIRDGIDADLRLKHRIDELLEGLSPDQRKVLEYKYMSGYCWEIIGFKMSYHPDHAKRIERAAVDALIGHIAIS